MIVFDEPTSSLTGHDVESLFRVIEKLKRSGMAVIYISHFLEEIRRIADRYVVLRDGAVAGRGELAGTSEAEIVALMVGRRVDDLFPSVPHAAGDVVLSLRDLAGRRTPDDVSFDLRRGEILGIAGLVGSGRTELLRCLMGLDPVRRGLVRIGGLAPRATVARGSAPGWGSCPKTARTKGWPSANRSSTTPRTAACRPIAASAGSTCTAADGRSKPGCSD